MFVSLVSLVSLVSFVSLVAIVSFVPAGFAGSPRRVSVAALPVARTYPPSAASAATRPSNAGWAAPSREPG